MQLLMRCLLNNGFTVGLDIYHCSTAVSYLHSFLYINLYLVYASVLVLMTLVKVLGTLVIELVTVVKVLVTMGKTIGDFFWSM